MLVVDLPIGTYTTPDQAVTTAKQLVDVGAEAVKLEGGLSHVAQIEAITRAGIPFMAHIGMLPQSVRDEGGYKIKGRTQAEAEALIADAEAVERAGAFSVVLEIVVADLAKRITNAIEIPTIGIGIGRALRWPDFSDARSDRFVPVVYAEVCFTGSARGG